MERTAATDLHLPAPPPGGALGDQPGPPVTGAPGAGGGGRGRAGVVALALVAGLLGGLLSAGAVLWTVDGSDAGGPTGGVAQETPTIDVEDGAIDATAAVAAAVLPAVVQIDIEGDGLMGPGQGHGSGVIYRSDGHIITNWHVVRGEGSVDVVLADGERMEGEVVGTDQLNDLAVVRVDHDDDLPTVAIGDSSAIQVGELAVAVGSPFGLEGSVTAGVISATNRPISVLGPDGEPVTLPNAVQTDAPINPGNSGGALANREGELIAINSAILTSGGPAGGGGNIGVGFAVPVNTAVDIADELIDRGFVEHPFLGVAGRDLTPELSQRLGVEEGAYIETVEPGTPAAEAGIAEDDVVVALAGEEIASMEDLIVAVRNHEVGETVTVEFVRDGETDEVELELTERPRPDAD